MPATVRIALGALAILLLTGTAFVLFAGDPFSLLARLRGEPLTVSPAVAELGEGQRGEATTFKVTLTNHTDREVRIVGGTSTCACLATADLPLMLSPGESQSISVRAKFTGSPGKFQHQFVLYTDVRAQRTLIARFAGRVLESTDPHEHPTVTAADSTTGQP